MFLKDCVITSVTKHEGYYRGWTLLPSLLPLFFLFLGEGRDGVGEQNNGRCQILAILFSVPGYLAIVYIVNIVVQ